MNILVQTDIPQTLRSAVSTRTMVFLIVAVAALTLVALGTLVWWWRGRRERAGEAQQDRSSASQVVLSIVQSEIGPVKGRLDELEKRINASVPHQGKEDLADTKLQAIQEELSKIAPALGQISDLLREVLVNWLGKEDRGRTDEKIEEIDERVGGAREAPRESAIASLDALLEQYDVYQVLALVKLIIRELEKVSENWERFEEDFSPYLQVAQRVEEMRESLGGLETSQQIPVEDNGPEMETEFEMLRSDLETLARNQRAIWFIDLIEEASHYPSIHKATTSLKQALGLEETQIALGTELRDMEDVDVVSTDGMGRNAVISEVLENGYRQKETGALLRKPKVKVTLEG